MSVENITLNIIPTGDTPSIHVAQFDVDRPFTVTLKEGTDDFTPTEYNIELQVRKVDATIVTVLPVQTSGNVVTFNTTEQMTACSGTNLAELQLTKDSQTFATLHFYLVVQRDVLAGGVTSESDIYNLTEQIAEIVPEVIGDDYYNKEEVDEKIAEIPTFDPTNYYDKSDVDTLLNDKADVSDLPDMTNYYDKSETDALLDDKADVSDLPDMNDYYTKFEVDTKITDLYQIKTASGSIVHITDGGDNIPVKKLKVNIDANLSGVSSVNVVDTPENKWTDLWTIDSSFRGVVAFNQLVQNGNFADTSNWITSNSSFTVSDNIASMLARATNGQLGTNVITIQPNHKYLCSASVKLTTGNTNIRMIANIGSTKSVYTANSTEWQTLETIVENTTNASGTVIIRDGRSSDWDTIQIKNVNLIDLTAMFGSTIADYIYNLEQNQSGSGVAFFHNLYPDNYYDYNSGTNEFVGGANKVVYPISLGGTYYGGVLDVTNGVLTVIYAGVDLGSLNWTYYQYGGLNGGYSDGIASDIKRPTSATEVVNAISSGFLVKSDNYFDTNPAYNQLSVSIYGRIKLNIDGVSDSATLKTALSGIMLVYELATPITLSITSQDIPTLSGENNIFSNCGDVEVKYFTEKSDGIAELIKAFM